MMVDSKATTGPPFFKAISTSGEVTNFILLLTDSFRRRSGFLQRSNPLVDVRRAVSLS
jgi:hypothetical protein